MPDSAATAIRRVKADHRVSALMLASFLPFSALVVFAWFTNAYFVTSDCTKGLVENHGRFNHVPMWTWWAMLTLEILAPIGPLALPACWLFRHRLTHGTVQAQWTTIMWILAIVVLSPFALAIIWSVMRLVTRS